MTPHGLYLVIGTFLHSEALNLIDFDALLESVNPK